MSIDSSISSIIGEMDLTGIIFAAFFFGIGVLFMGFLSFLPYIKDRSDVRKKIIKYIKL